VGEKQTIEKINKDQMVFGMINKIDKPLAGLTKIARKKMYFYQ
jgi:hypothetical protein